jgi:hypothetical protein
MSRHHLDRLFANAFTAEEAVANGPPRRRGGSVADACRADADAEDAAAAAAAGGGATATGAGAAGAAGSSRNDPAEPARILAAFKKRDYAACLGLPSVALDALGRPVWEVTDRRVMNTGGRGGRGCCAEAGKRLRSVCGGRSVLAPLSVCVAPRKSTHARPLPRADARPLSRPAPPRALAQRAEPRVPHVLAARAP